MAIIGTWAYSGEESEILYSATFNTDRTVVFDGPQPKYPSRWRIEGTVLVFQHKYQTVIGNTPVPIPAAVKRLELPAIMAHKEEVLRPMTLSPDGCSMILEAVSGVAPACTLARTKANASNGSENEPVITE